MTVGERLQTYRKQKNLSQEDLAKQLLVTRQTISLWENDQTLPTVDNLIRLQEILGVSIDNILTEPKAQDLQSLAALETYFFQYTADSFRATTKIITKNPFVKSIKIILVLVCFILFMIASSTPDAVIGIFIGILCTSIVSFLKSVIVVKKQNKSDLPKLLENIYTYEVFADYFKITITKGNRVQSQKFVYRDQIQQCWITDTLCIFDCGGQLYCFSKVGIPSSAHIFSFFQSAHTEKQVQTNSVLRLRRIGNLLFVLSLILLPLAVMLLSSEESGDTFALPSLWKLYFLLPIPIASVVSGFLLKRKGERAGKNIVAGVIVAFLLLIYGSFPFVFADTYDTNPELLTEIEQLVQIDLPNSHNIVTNYDFVESSSDSTAFGYRSLIHFTDEEVADFESALPEDTRWQTEMPSMYAGLLPSLKPLFTKDYFVLYNIDTQQYNTYPDTDGTYKWLYITYDVNANSMEVIAYTKEIVLSVSVEDEKQPS